MNLNLEKPIEHDYKDPKGNMNLDTSYELTVAELGLQQTKRDQIIAFYISVIGFITPNLIGLDLPSGIKGCVFFALYIVGLLFVHVIIRYRIYKEVYWIACRVITQLYNIFPERRYEDVIYRIFYNELKENRDTIVKWKEHGKKKGEISYFRSFKRQVNSAETILFETLTFMCTAVGALSAFYLWDYYLFFPFLPAGILIIVMMVVMAVVVNYKYSTRLIKLYECIESEEKQAAFEAELGGLKDEKERESRRQKHDEAQVKALKASFKKAWMLRCFLDDILEETNGEGENEAKA